MEIEGCRGTSEVEKQAKRQEDKIWNAEQRDIKKAKKSPLEHSESEAIEIIEEMKRKGEILF